MMCPDHPDIVSAMATGYPRGVKDEYDEIRCCECGRVIEEDEDVYECRTHATLCEECLKMLHRRYV